MISQLFKIVLFCSLSMTSQAGDFVTLRDGVSRYYELHEPVAESSSVLPNPGQTLQKKKPTIILINGLVYELSRWNVLRQDLNKKGYRVLNYYMRGQFRTLRAEVEKSKVPEFFSKGLTLKDLAEELEEMRQILIPQDDVVVVGLSFGSTVASEYSQRYPQKIRKLVFMAPLVLPTDRYNPQGQWVFQSLEWIRAWWGPFLGPQFYDQVYNWIYRSYLNQRIVPEKIPTEMQDMAAEYKEALFHLVRTTRDFDLREKKYPDLPLNSIHFFLAKEEEKEVFDDQIKAFDQTPKEQKGLMIYFEESAHAIPDSRPLQASRYLDFVIAEDPRIQSHKKYRANAEGLFLFEK